jgi:hypothetical protein
MVHGSLTPTEYLFHEVLHVTNHNLEQRHLSPARVRMRKHEQRVEDLGISAEAVPELLTLAKIYQGEIAALHHHAQFPVIEEVSRASASPISKPPSHNHRDR